MTRKFGPWACTYTSNHAHDYRITKPNGSALPVNAPGNDRSEQREIARLIAAAPDMLKALDAAEDELVNYLSTLENSKAVACVSGVLAEVRAAIAKATGQ